MNHRAKFDAASFILAGEIRNRTNKQTNKQKSTQTVTNISIIYIYIYIYQNVWITIDVDIFRKGNVDQKCIQCIHLRNCLSCHRQSDVFVIPCASVFDRRADVTRSLFRRQYATRRLRH